MTLSGKDGDGVTDSRICSHLFPKEVLWSSKPEKLKTSIDTNIKFGTEENEVVNTWFVTDPTISLPGL